MSVKAISAVWEHSTLTGTELLAMLAIADYAHDDGAGAWPSVPKLRQKMRLETDRGVQKVLRRCEAAGELVIHTGKGPYGTNLYDIAPHVMRGEKRQGVNVETPPGERRDTPTGERRDTPPVNGGTPNPSSYPSSYPSINTSDDDAPVLTPAISPAPKPTRKPASKGKQPTDPLDYQQAAGRKAVNSRAATPDTPPLPSKAFWIEYWAGKRLSGMNVNILADKAVRDKVTPEQVDALIEAAARHFDAKGERVISWPGWLFSNITTHGWQWETYPHAQGGAPPRAYTTPHRESAQDAHRRNMETIANWTPDSVSEEMKRLLYGK